MVFRICCPGPNVISVVLACQHAVICADLALYRHVLPIALLADEEEDNEAVAGSLIDALVDANALELLVERLTKMNESVDEEASAVNNALAIIEHAVEVRLWLLIVVTKHCGSYGAGQAMRFSSWMTTCWAEFMHG